MWGLYRIKLLVFETRIVHFRGWITRCQTKRGYLEYFPYHLGKDSLVSIHPSGPMWESLYPRDKYVTRWIHDILDTRRMGSQRCSEKPIEYLKLQPTDRKNVSYIICNITFVSIKQICGNIYKSILILFVFISFYLLQFLW